MEKELQQQLAKSIQDFTSTLSSMKDFTLEQAPDVIHQFIMWTIVQNSIAICLCLFGIWASWFTTFKITNQKPDLQGDWASSKIISAAIGGILSAFMVLQILSSTFTLAQIWIAPKVWLITQAANLIK